MATAVVIPVFGNHVLTHSLMADLESEKAEEDLRIVVVDDFGRGDLPTLLTEEGPYDGHGADIVLSNEYNVGWAKSAKRGLDHFMGEMSDCDAVVILSNDVRLSRHFVSGLREAHMATGAGVVGPVYNQDWSHQLCKFRGPAVAFESSPVDTPAPFIDRTAMLVRRSTLDVAGGFDVELTPKFGWGVDIDFAMRVRRSGMQLIVTERSYLEHARAVTYSKIDSDYLDLADAEARLSLATRYGSDWVDQVWSDFRLPESYDDLKSSAP